MEDASTSIEISSRIELIKISKEFIIYIEDATPILLSKKLFSISVDCSPVPFIGEPMFTRPTTKTTTISPRGGGGAAILSNRKWA